MFMDLSVLLRSTAFPFFHIPRNFWTSPPLLSRLSLNPQSLYYNLDSDSSEPPIPFALSSFPRPAHNSLFLPVIPPLIPVPLNPFCPPITPESCVPGPVPSGTSSALLKIGSRSTLSFVRFISPLFLSTHKNFLAGRTTNLLPKLPFCSFHNPRLPLLSGSTPWSSPDLYPFSPSFLSPFTT